MDIVFIAGPPRSGTTLTAGLLQGDNTYPMLPECTYLSRLMALCNEIQTYPDKTRYESYIKTDDSLYRIFQPSVKTMIENSISNFDTKEILVLKDPELSMILGVLPKLIPFKFKIVACIRDPRDVVASWLNVMKKKHEPTHWLKSLTGKNKPYDFEAEILKLFEYYYRIIQAEKVISHDIFKVFRYEDVVTETGAQALATFTGCNVGIGGAYATRSFEFDKDDPFNSVNYGSEVTLGSLRRFEKDLTRSEISKVEEMFAGVMLWGGYE